MSKREYPPKVVEAAKNQNINLDEGNVIIPSENFGHDIGKYDKVVIEIMRVNPNPQEEEVYKQGEKLAFTGKTLYKVSNLIDIRWDPSYTGLIHSTGEERVAKAVGAVRNSHGDWVPVSASKTIDIGAYEEEMIDKYTEEADRGDCRRGPDGKFINATWEKSTNGKPYPKFGKWPDEQTKERHIRRMVRKAVLIYRGFANEKAETGAMLRAIRKLYPFKSAYREEELMKPFYLPRIATDNEKLMQNIELRDKVLNRAMGSRALIFGNNDAPLEATIRQERSVDAEIITEFQEVQEEPQTTEKYEMSPEEEEVIALKADLEAYLQNNVFPEGTVKAINGFIDDPEITASALRGHIESIEKFIDEHLGGDSE